MRKVIIACIGVGLTAGLSLTAANGPSQTSRVDANQSTPSSLSTPSNTSNQRALLDRYCVNCHNEIGRASCRERVYVLV